MNYKIYTNEEKDAMASFPKELKAIRINQDVCVGNIKIEPTKSSELFTELVLFDDCELRIRHTHKENGISHTLAPLDTKDIKLIWQKAQQQVDEKQNKE
jgi:hypothetical protein